VRGGGEEEVTGRRGSVMGRRGVRGGGEREKRGRRSTSEGQRN